MEIKKYAVIPCFLLP